VAVSEARLALDRDRIVAYRRRANGLDERLPPGADSLRSAARAGLQDSMPRAAVLSIHARVAGTVAEAWEDPALVQLWGPRFSAYAVAAEDRAWFTLGRLPDGGPRRARSETWAERLCAFLGGRRMRHDEAARAMGVPHANVLRYAAPTGTVLIRWDGARQPTIWCVPRPPVGPAEARRELVRRYLGILGPGTPASFGAWAGVTDPVARATFAAMRPELLPVATPIGDAWILARDEAAVRAEPGGMPAAVRLLPSGDAFFLLQGGDRELLVPDAGHRRQLWTSRVWPGALLLEGEVAGTWRRAGSLLSLQPWRPLTRAERAAVEAEAAGLPLPGLAGPVRVA
jgi:hypothetical protein